MADDLFKRGQWRMKTEVLKVLGAMMQGTLRGRMNTPWWRPLRRRQLELRLATLTLCLREFDSLPIATFVEEETVDRRATNNPAVPPIFWHPPESNVR